MKGFTDYGFIIVSIFVGDLISKKIDYVLGKKGDTLQKNIHFTNQGKLNQTYILVITALSIIPL